VRKSITQKHEFGCGVACVAFVVNKSYEEAVEILGRKRAAKKGFYCRDLVKVLKRFNLNYSFRYLQPRLKQKIYQDRIIVFIKRSKKYPFGHYLVRYKNLWMDPWINFSTNKKINEAKSGYCKRLLGRPIYGLFPDS